MGRRRRRRADRAVRHPPAGGGRLREAQPRAEGAPLPRPPVRRPARAGARGAGARPLCRARPVHRPRLVRHRARAAEPEGRPRGRRDRDRGRHPAAAGGAVPPGHRARAVVRRRVGPDGAAARLPHHAHRGGVGAGTAGHLGAPRRRRGVPRGAVPGPARPARRAHDGGTEPRGLRAHGDAPGGRRRRPRPGRRRRGPVPAHRADGRRAARVPAGRDRVLPDPHQHQDDDRRGAPRGDRRRDPARDRGVVDHGHERHRQRQHAPQWLVGLLAFMAAMSVAMLVWAHRQGWW